jgi:hypothetical protein
MSFDIDPTFAAAADSTSHLIAIYAGTKTIIFTQISFS